MHRGLARRSRAPVGFTLIELLVVVAILAALVGLTLPAVQKVRAAAARTTCLNNLHQIGVACHAHLNEKGKFPPGVIELRIGNTPTRRQLAWCCYVLPYLEQSSLYAQLRLDTPFDSPQNAGPAATVLKVFVCPATTRGSLVVSGRGACDYGGIVGQLNMTATSPPAPNGAMIYDTWLKPEDIRDGLAATVLVSEDCGWADGQWINGRNVFEQSGPINVFPATDNEMRSEHRGGVNALFADGSARFVRETIPLGTLAAICTRAGNETVSPDDF